MPASSPSSPEKRAGDRPHRRGRLIVIAGPGGVGKSTIVSEVRRRIPVHFSVSATTRPPRPGEVDGFHYRFVDVDRFRSLIDRGDLLEWAIFNGNYYGTPRDAVEAALTEGRDVLAEIEVQGARQVRQVIPEALMLFVAPPSLADLRRRLEARGDTSRADIEAKLALADQELNAAPELFDHIVVNDDIDRAVDEVVSLIGSSACGTRPD